MKNSNKFNQETEKRPTASSSSRTSLKDLSDFHPRLSTRAALSSKINEDSLVLIQQLQPHQQQQSISISPNTTNTNTNEFPLRSEDLMANLTQFVGSDGLIKESVDIQNYAQLMQCEAGPSQQILLLKIIIATLNSNPNISEKLVECESLMIVIGLWLGTVEPEKLVESILVGKILEVLSRLNFTVDQLVKYKFGRIVKKIVQLKDKHENNQNIQLALKIYNLWNTLASKSEITIISRRKSEDENNNSNLAEIANQNDSAASQIKLQQDQTQTYEIGRKRSISIATNSNLIDESNEKKFKLNVSTTIKDIGNDNNIKFNSPKVKKRVSFPNTAEKLCKIILFERAPEEYEFLSDGSASRDSYLHADLGEASKAFERFKVLNDCDEMLVSLKPWKTPEILAGSIEVPEGSESEEKIIQHQRERTVLSVTYFSNNDIPSNPLEVDVDTSVNGDNNCKTIPIRANESILKHQIAIRTAPPSLVIPAMFNTPEVFTNLISNNSALNTLMNPFASVPEVTPVTFNNFYDPNNINNFVNNKYNDNGNNNRNNGFDSYTPPEWNPYRQESQGTNRSDFKRSNSYSMKTTSEEISGYSSHSQTIIHKDRSKEFTGRRPMLTGGNGSLARSKKINCRHYRPGRPDSCELGSSCRFAHQDYH